MTTAVAIPTIGIGAGAGTDAGACLAGHGRADPRHAAEVRQAVRGPALGVTGAVTTWAQEVVSGSIRSRAPVPLKTPQEPRSRSNPASVRAAVGRALGGAPQSDCGHAHVSSGAIGRSPDSTVAASTKIAAPARAISDPTASASRAAYQSPDRKSPSPLW